MKIAEIQRRLSFWLRQGISPQRLALTLALGCAVGCIPVIGVPTLLCTCLALALRLNLPAMQAANYAVMPAQILLVLPLVRFGSLLLPASLHTAVQPMALLHTSPLAMAGGVGILVAQALLAWLVIAIPTVLLMTLTLTALLRRIPALAAAEAAD